jgi:ankyrin repeat protein
MYVTWLSAVFPIINETEDSLLNLRHAAWRGDTEVVKAIGWLGDDFKASVTDMLTALHLAVFNMHKGAAKALLDTATPLNWLLAEKQSYSPLHVAAANNDVEMIKMLLAAGADVNAYSRSDGGTPLAWTELLECTDAWKVLKAAGGQAKVTDHRESWELAPPASSTLLTILPSTPFPIMLQECSSTTRRPF